MSSRLVYLTPLIVAVGLGFILYTAIGKDPSKLETARLNDPLPAFELESLLNPETRFTQTALVGEMRLLNVWATWCPACRAEHPFLNQLAEQGYKIVGLNYKDERQAAKQWLTTLGNPYEFNLYDPQGTLGFDLGVYGAPETYIIDAKGFVRHRHVGELNTRVWNESVLPVIQQVQGGLE